MNRFHNLPIRQKLTIIVLSTCSVLVLLIALIFITEKYYTFRRNMISNTETLAQVIGMNSTAALTFQDPDTAVEILSALSAEPNVAAACIFQPNGQTFATYPRTHIVDERYKSKAVELIAQIRTDENLNAAAHEFIDRQLMLAKPIQLNRKQIGYVVIRTNLNQLYNRLTLSGVLVVGVMVALVLMAQLVSARLHRSISDPLLALVATMKQVTADKNYALRARKQNNDELGILIDGFNGMLAQIQQRDQQLEQHSQQLESQVIERTRELLCSNDRLKKEMEERKEMQGRLARAQRMEAVGTLAAGVAHDLNNILSGIVSYPDLLLMRLPADSEMRKPLTTILHSGQKAAAIVQDLLTLARRGVTTSEVVNLKAIVEDYFNSPEHEKLMTFHANVHVIRHIDADLMDIAGSSVHLGKSIMNLISNAAEAIHGQGTIIITLRNQYIDTPIRGYDQVQQGDYVMLKICDTGHGIAAEDLERIFEPFYTKKKMGRSGTGLGMAVVWGTVKDHQGYIDVESREGAGTTFTLYFPATRQQMAAKQPLQTGTYKGNGETILVVDDIKEQREIASDILQTLGYTVATVAGGQAALEYLVKHRVDLLILDMVMDPGIDGLETYKRIVTRGLPQRAIIASGYSESERVKKAQALGAGAYLRKPYTIESLALAVYRELEKN